MGRDWVWWLIFGWVLYGMNRSFIYVQEHIPVGFLVHPVLDREQAAADLGQAQYQWV